jgi:type IV pilus assembly protein PilC
MTEFTVKLADERGRIQEQVHSAATAEELRARFTQAGYLVYAVKPKSSLLGAAPRKRSSWGRSSSSTSNF